MVRRRVNSALFVKFAFFGCVWEICESNALGGIEIYEKVNFFIFGRGAFNLVSSGPQA